MYWGGDDAQILCAHAHDVTGMELSTAPEFRRTIDGHLTAGDQHLRIGSGGGAGKLE